MVDDFDRHFKDIRRHRPQPGEALVYYHDALELADGRLKEDVIRILTEQDGGAAYAVKLLRSVGNATEESALRVVTAIAEDLLVLPAQHVLRKVYPYEVGLFYFVAPEHVPDDPHWEVVSKDFLAEAGGI